ncbi:MAG: hypothetical protein QW320_06825 [Ignisphaera sp.]|uniref:hypothetical protein n=1 Tax=Thermofilum sp. TaxID=1961369 RepID=UPI003165F66A
MDFSSRDLIAVVVLSLSVVAGYLSVMPREIVAGVFMTVLGYYFGYAHAKLEYRRMSEDG